MLVFLLLLLVSAEANGPSSQESARIRLSQTSLDYGKRLHSV